MKNFLKDKYLKALRNTENSIHQVNNAKRVFDTFNSALKTFYNKKIEVNSKTLDLGYGDGAFLKLLEREKINSKGYDYDTINFENEKIPEVSNSIDFITCNSVIEHLNDVSNLMNETYRILKPGGKLILITPNFQYDYKQFYDDPTHVNPFTVAKLNNILELHGYQNIKILPWIVKKSPFLWKLPFNFFFARYLLIARNDTTLPIPIFLRGKSTVMFSIAEKI